MANHKYLGAHCITVKNEYTQTVDFIGKTKLVTNLAQAYNLTGEQQTNLLAGKVIYFELGTQIDCWSLRVYVCSCSKPASHKHQRFTSISNIRHTNIAAETTNAMQHDKQELNDLLETLGINYRAK